MVKESDLKSDGLCPRRFKSCCCRSFFYFNDGEKTRWEGTKQKNDATPRGFEPLRTKSIHLAGERLNHSAKVSLGMPLICTVLGKKQYDKKVCKNKNKKGEGPAGIEPATAGSAILCSTAEL